MVLGAPATESDPEIEHLKKVYRKEVGAAFEETVRGLARRIATCCAATTRVR